MRVFDHAQFGKVRSMLIDGEPWFVAADVCRALDINNTTDAIKRLDADERLTLDSIEGGLGGAQKINVINESGLYSLVLGSRKVNVYHTDILKLVFDEAIDRKLVAGTQAHSGDRARAAIPAHSSTSTHSGR